MHSVAHYLITESTDECIHPKWISEFLSAYTAILYDIVPL